MVGDGVEEQSGTALALCPGVDGDAHPISIATQNMQIATRNSEIS